jgi:hypothetical protein
MLGTEYIVADDGQVRTLPQIMNDKELFQVLTHKFRLKEELERREKRLCILVSDYHTKLNKCREDANRLNGRRTPYPDGIYDDVFKDIGELKIYENINIQIREYLCICNMRIESYAGKCHIDGDIDDAIRDTINDGIGAFLAGHGSTIVIQTKREIKGQYGPEYETDKVY